MNRLTQFNTTYVVRLKSSVQLLNNFVSQFVSIRPDYSRKPFIKVLAKPYFLGGPQTKYSQIQPICADRFAPFSTVFCFSSVSTPVFLLKALKARKAHIMVNQNGVYYPAWFPKNWQKKNHYLKELDKLSDFTFFQSKFALDSFEYWIGKPSAPHTILHNPVDHKIFFPRKEEPRHPYRLLVFADVSSFTQPLWKYILKLKKAFEQDLHLKDLEWVFLGRIIDQSVYDELQLGGLADSGLADSSHADGSFATGSVPEVLCSCDVALHFVYNDVCPNKVLECLASGVWVIGLSAGGTKELITEGGEVLEVQEGYDIPYFPDMDQVRQALHRFLARPIKCRESAYNQSLKFGLDQWHQRIQG